MVAAATRDSLPEEKARAENNLVRVAVARRRRSLCSLEIRSLEPAAKLRQSL
jgi:hypothetical protein